MKIKACLSIVAMALLAGGCSGITGTWTADKDAGGASPIAHVSFCQDGTFTADAKYPGGSSRAMSGHYSATGGTLKLTTCGNERSYAYAVEGDVLTITHNGSSASLNRLK